MKVPQLHSINESRDSLKSLNTLLERRPLPIIPVIAYYYLSQIYSFDKYINIVSLLASGLQERQHTPSRVERILLL